MVWQPGSLKERIWRRKEENRLKRSLGPWPGAIGRTSSLANSGLQALLLPASIVKIRATAALAWETILKDSNPGPRHT